MEKYLYEQGNLPISVFYRNSIAEYLHDRKYRLIFPHSNFIIVYLEEFTRKNNGSYNLLLDFFAFSDYTRFNTELETEKRIEGENEQGIPQSTFFYLNNYQTDDEPIKGAHYYLDIRALKGLSPEITLGEDEGFPVLYTLTLSQNGGDVQQVHPTLLYQTQPLTYPQWVFSSLRNTNNPVVIPSNANTELVVWDVKQGNFNEIKVNGQPYAIYDSGTEVMNATVPFRHMRLKLTDELNTSIVPLYVLSHWHTDHYSLLFSLNNNDLRKIQYYIFPSNAKSFSIFCFIARLMIIGACINMVVLPFGKPWIRSSINGSLTLYANKNYRSNVNNSGLTLFIQGPNNNAMLSGDCRYTLAESQANDCISTPMTNGMKHYLVIPHHGGKAGTVSYRLPNASLIEGIVSVGAHNKHGHPNPTVMRGIGRFLQPGIEMTMMHGDITKLL